MNVAFFGTSDRSIPILESLHKNFELKLIITKEDKPVGRKQILKPSEVKVWAIKNRVRFVTINNFNPTNTETVISELKKLNIEIGVVADFSFIIPESVVNIPKFKLVNIHFSLLPKYRGASPIQFCLLNGDKHTGITFYIMDKNMDTGDIIYQEKINLTGKETSKDLYTSLFDLAGSLCNRVINEYTSGSLKPKKQTESEATYTFSKSNPKKTVIIKNDARLDWNLAANVIDRTVKAFYPWPIAWTTFEDISQYVNLNVRDTRLMKNKISIIDTQVDNDKLIIKKVKPEGKNEMDFKSFLNGYFIQ